MSADMVRDELAEWADVLAEQETVVAVIVGSFDSLLVCAAENYVHAWSTTTGKAAK